MPRHASLQTRASLSARGKRRRDPLPRPAEGGAHRARGGATDARPRTTVRRGRRGRPGIAGVRADARVLAPRPVGERARRTVGRLRVRATVAGRPPVGGAVAPRFRPRANPARGRLRKNEPARTERRVGARRSLVRRHAGRTGHGSRATLAVAAGGAAVCTGGGNDAGVQAAIDRAAIEGGAGVRGERVRRLHLRRRRARRAECKESHRKERASIHERSKSIPHARRVRMPIRDARSGDVPDRDVAAGTPWRSPRTLRLRRAVGSHGRAEELPQSSYARRSCDRYARGGPSLGRKGCRG
jgi:hypothetical protein